MTARHWDFFKLPGDSIVQSKLRTPTADQGSFANIEDQLINQLDPKDDRPCGSRDRRDMAWENLWGGHDQGLGMVGRDVWRGEERPDSEKRTQRGWDQEGDWGLKTEAQESGIKWEAGGSNSNTTDWELLRAQERWAKSTLNRLERQPESCSQILWKPRPSNSLRAETLRNMKSVWPQLWKTNTPFGVVTYSIQGKF